MKATSKSHSRKVVVPERQKEDLEHNIRTYSEATSLELSLLIATILGELDYSLNEATEEKSQREKANWNAVSAAERALLFTRNLKYFSRTEPNPPEIFDFSQLILDCIELAEPELNHRGIRPRVLVDTNIIYEGDPGCIEQIMLNLLELVKKNLSKDTLFETSLSNQGDIQLTFRFDLIKPLEDQTLSLLLIRSLAESMNAEAVIKTSDSEFKAEISFPQNNSRKSLINFSEARRYRRIRLKLPALLSFSRCAVPLRTEINLLSVGGCFSALAANEKFVPEVNETFSIRIDYFKDCFIEVTKARVASLRWAGGKPGIGIEFLELPPHTQRIIRALVKSHA